MGEDVALSKRTYISQIREDFNVEFRAQFFNIFNRTNFGVGGIPPRPNPADLTRFGVPNNARSGPRSGQIVGRFQW
jgi:hypothetical protein